MKDCPVAVIQTECLADAQVCREQAERAVREAAKSGAQLVLLPELYQAMRPRAALAALIEPAPGPSTERWAKIARELRIWLLAGSMPERAPQRSAGPVSRRTVAHGRKGKASREVPRRKKPREVGRFFNTALIFNDQGDLVARYRKLHRFDVDLPGVVRFLESESTEAGNEVCAIETPWGVLGLAICYDLRFPELFRALSDRGVEIIAVPSAFSHGTGAAHWHTLVRARAIENQAFVLAPNQCGHAPNGFESFGHSLIVDPWGRVLEEAAQAPVTLCATLAAATLDDTRAGLPALRHRRRDLFSERPE